MHSCDKPSSITRKRNFAAKLTPVMLRRLERYQIDVRSRHMSSISGHDTKQRISGIKKRSRVGYACERIKRQGGITTDEYLRLRKLTRQTPR